MGICASCLGLNRHPSQDSNETNPLLNDRQDQYGGVGDADASQPDEEDVRREREELDQITTEATECVKFDHTEDNELTNILSNMIDVSHPGTSELSQHFAHARPTQPEDVAVEDTTPAQEDDEEAAWLQSVQDGETEDVTAVKGLHSSDLILDMSQLREESAGPSAAKRSLKGRLPQ